MSSPLPEKWLFCLPTKLVAQYFTEDTLTLMMPAVAERTELRICFDRKTLFNLQKTHAEINNGFKEIFQRPRIPHRAVSAIAAGAQFLKELVTGDPLASKQLQEERLKICNNCPNNQIVATFPIDVVQCVKCGCFTKPKIALQFSKCPENKW